ncbi:MAG: DUF1223 domain-containing protein [Pseudomonadota bacterium]
MRFQDLRAALAAVSISILAPAVWADEPAPGGSSSTMATGEAGPIVVELFTSQSCSSCPPAEAHLQDLAEAPGVVALQWHVDYWNDLVHGASGRWKDPYSDPAYSARQRAYNRRVRGRSSVYTPQIFIDGARETVGSNRAETAALIAAGAGPREARLTLSGDGLRVEGDGAGEVWLIRFIETAVTDVEAGENVGRRLRAAHIVDGAEKLADWPGGDLKLPAPAVGPCAILVQEPGQGRILAGAYCSSAAPAALQKS